MIARPGCVASQERECQFVGGVMLVKSMLFMLLGSVLGPALGIALFLLTHAN
jgi:hypothetical protein